MKFNDERDWFFKNRFGMFIHWGVYAIPAFHEQVQNIKAIPRSEYARLAERFNPLAFDPDAWLDLAQDVGMTYLTFTTKHHDGFCMWATDQTDFNITNTPYGRDTLRLLAEACQRRNIPLCLYHSVVDWRHPNYPNQGRHHELSEPESGDQPDCDRYLDYLKAQVRELCTRYGKLHGWWWDMNVAEVNDPSVNAMIRELQPGIIINDRGMDPGDFGTPEREYDETIGGKRCFERPTEACQSIDTRSWGYKTDADFYSDGFLIRAMDGYLARGANYLLNVGPDATGVIPDISARMLRRVGDWYKRIRESVEDTEPASDLTENPSVLLTRRENVIYVHCHQLPESENLSLKPIRRLPEKAILMNTGEPVTTVVDCVSSDWKTGEKYLRLRKLPVNALANEALVIKLVFPEA